MKRRTPTAIGSLFLVLTAGVLLCAAGAPAWGQVIPLLDPLSLTKFQDPLYSVLSNIAAPDDDYNGLALYDINISQFKWNFSSQGALANGTTVWGYGYKDTNGVIHNSMPGPTFVQQSGVPIAVRYTNNLVDEDGNALKHILPLDTTLMGVAGVPENRTVVHLHGGHLPGIYDGGPMNWFSSDPSAPANGMGGPAGNSVIYQYPNNQPAALIWYHDHTLGETHLNPYAGMAGGYKIVDAHEASLNLPTLVPLVLQDKLFTADGQLFYPRGPGDLVHPGGANPLEGLPANFPSQASIVTEMFGNVNVVNGTVWPYMDVDAKKYRLNFLDGAQARAYILQLTTPDGTTLPMYQIGTDGGLLPATVVKTSITMMPGERVDACVDFSGLAAGTLVTLKNLGPDMMFGDPTLPAADPNTSGQVMQFRIKGAPSTPDTSNIPLNPNTVTRLLPQNAAGKRTITLKENTTVDPWGRLMVMLNQTPYEAATTEIVKLGDTEVWQFINLTPDTHPMHLHDVEFQIVGRHKLLVDPVTGEFTSTPDPNAADLPPEADEMGWKDTLQCPSGFETDIIAQFLDYTGEYVYHCHILEHEEFDMMRPFEVVEVPEPATMMLLIGGLAMLARRRRAA
ncbi:MAG: multicopper oxidase domain-containing protein [Planctomycetota bacterium]|nr:multicopper oxidase domain-containing protein [Planctomycetota bacterium]